MGRSWGAPEPGRQGLEIDQGPGCTPGFLQQGHALPAALPHVRAHTHTRTRTRTRTRTACPLPCRAHTHTHTRTACPLPCRAHTHTHCLHTHTLCMPANYAASELCKCLPLRHSARVKEGPATFLGPWASPWLWGGTRFD